MITEAPPFREWKLTMAEVMQLAATELMRLNQLSMSADSRMTYEYVIAIKQVEGRMPEGEVGTVTVRVQCDAGAEQK